MTQTAWTLDNGRTVIERTDHGFMVYPESSLAPHETVAGPFTSWDQVRTALGLPILTAP
jgi:hypothetical protein